MAATGVAAMLSSSQRSYRRSSGDAGTRYAAHALPVSCVHIVACISPICDYECVTPTGNTHDHAGPCFITNAQYKHIYTLQYQLLAKQFVEEWMQTNHSRLLWWPGPLSQEPLHYQIVIAQACKDHGLVIKWVCLIFWSCDVLTSLMNLGSGLLLFVILSLMKYIM